uniref:SERINC4 protein n=1 Tax=Fopius arisanus TaxID=64838 RepID=A0A0C9RUK6_9HYME
MTIIKIIGAVGAFFGLITITGCLTILALLSRILEFCFILVPPVCLFLLQKSRILISSSIVGCGQMTCRVLSRISSRCPSESRLEIAGNRTIEFPLHPSSYNPEIGIGIVPVAVPYTRTNIDTEHLEEFSANSNQEIIPEIEEEDENMMLN